MVQKLWLKHCVWLKENLKECFESLNPPATKEDLLAFESYTGYELPDDLKQLYLLNNGQKPDCFTGAWWGLAFIPLNHLVEYHLSKDTPIDMTSQDTSFPERAIKLYNTNPKWVPFAEDGAFNYLAIDLDPGINGTVGQVINFGRDEREKCVVARSLENFLDFMTKEIENGNYKIKDYGFEEKAFNYKSSHLLDDLKELLINKS